jgi:signal peptidase II
MAGNGIGKRTHFGLGLAVIAAVVLIDQVAKWWVLEIIRLQERAPIEITSFFQLAFVRNRGVSFGMLHADSFVAVWGLALLSGAIALFFLWWMRVAERSLTALALALVVGGAIGNLIDRVRFGGVVDFLDFSGLMFPWVFNVADASITVGAALLILDYMTNGEERAGAKAK